jgi:hypothetical protein
MAREGRARRPGKRADLEDRLARGAGGDGRETIGEAEFEALRQELAPISEGYLRKLLRESGAPLAPMVAGVRQGNLDELESSLLALLDEYERGDAMRRSAVRRLVITAKDHARWAAKRADKEEVILWLLTWLENPPVFRDWVRLRRVRLSN